MRSGQQGLATGGNQLGHCCGCGIGKAAMVPPFSTVPWGPTWPMDTVFTVEENLCGPNPAMAAGSDSLLASSHATVTLQ